MISPKVYQKQIHDLEIEGKEISPQNKDDASILFEELKNIEKVLEHIRYNIRMDIRAIRKDYMKKIRETVNSSEFKAENDKKSLKNKIKGKKHFIYERDLKIAPYEPIEYMIEDYLTQLKDAKKYVTAYSKKLKK